MQTYHVMWEIDIDAQSPIDAARQALACLQEPGTQAVVFDVTDEKGETTTRVDLLEEDQTEEGTEGDL